MILEKIFPTRVFLHRQVSVLLTFSYAAFLTNLLQPSTATKTGLKEKKHAFKITILLIRSTCFSCMLIYSPHNLNLSSDSRGTPAVMPVILVKPIDTSPLASVNISPPTKIPTSLSTWEALKNVAPFVQKIVLKSSTLFPHVSNWKLKKLCISFGSSHL